jgi:signal transduction histidine kinase
MQMLSNRAFGEITDEQKKYLEIMLQNTNRLDNLVSDLVDISRIESGSMTFTSKKTIVSKMVNEAVEKMQSSANEKNIAVNVEIEDQIPDLIVDQDRIKQVIINILGNAIKSSPDKTTVNLRAKKQEIDVLFEIQDQGISIPKDKQKKMFNAFYRADEGKSKEYSGGGIRLALSRSIVTIHGGKIWMESEEGKGNTFRFTLPIKPVDNIQTRCKESDIFESKKDDENIENN